MTVPRCTGVKICRNCSQEKSVLAFSVRSTSPDGLASDCRECLNEYNKKYQRKKEHSIDRAFSLNANSE